MRNICRQIVGDNLKGEMALFSFPHPSGGEELRGAPLVYIPDLVQKVVDLLEENERLNRRSRHKPCKIIFNPMQDSVALQRNGAIFFVQFEPGICTVSGC